MAREEGAAALWKGLAPGLQRQLINGGLRIGLYDPIKSRVADAVAGGQDTLGVKVISGLLSGALAISVANPTDLVKVRMQAEGRLPPGVAKRYTSSFNAYSTIARCATLPPPVPGPPRRSHVCCCAGRGA